MAFGWDGDEDAASLQEKLEEAAFATCGLGYRRSLLFERPGIGVSNLWLFRSARPVLAHCSDVCRVCVRPLGFFGEVLRLHSARGACESSMPKT
mmetsp:Transcript_2360/g.4051  ORF Transcript_2360/g.4051 Transcript_2360/m.4051 type:complete len:94 (+) Transcript_2360:329-610(+)